MVQQIINKLVDEFHYAPLPKAESDKYRKFYLNNLPPFFNIYGQKVMIYTKNDNPICYGYTRIVIGDYGPFIEFTPDMANVEAFVVKQGQEYRIDDPKYRNHVKYDWLTIDDDSDIKIYHQKKPVLYADYKPGMYYVSPYECKFGPDFDV